MRHTQHTAAARSPTFHIGGDVALLGAGVEHLPPHAARVRRGHAVQAHVVQPAGEHSSQYNVSELAYVGELLFVFNSASKSCIRIASEGS